MEYVLGQFGKVVPVANFARELPADLAAGRPKVETKGHRKDS